MQVPLLVERRKNGRVRVSGMGRGPLGWEAEGDSVGEAKALLRQRILEALQEDVSYDTLELEMPTPVSIDDFCGDLKEDPLFGEWQEAILEYRKERNAA